MPINIPKAPRKEDRPVRPARAKKIKAEIPEGLRDISSHDFSSRLRVVRALESAAEYFGFIPYEPSPLEDRALVEKLFSGKNRDQVCQISGGKRSFVLRPFIIPGLLRAFHQRGMVRTHNPAKLWFEGWVWKRSVPGGVLEESRQGGMAILNNPDPVYDAQVIASAYYFALALGHKHASVVVNSIGCLQCRKLFVRRMKDHYKGKTTSLCSDCVSSYREGSVRLVGCANPECQTHRAEAPIVLDHLCSLCKNHFKTVLEYLDALSVPYAVDPYLVGDERIWNRTIVRVITNDQDGVVLGEGGRMDNFSSLVCGPKMAAVGFWFDMQTVIDSLPTQSRSGARHNAHTVFLIYMGPNAKRRALSLLVELKDAGFFVQESFSRSSLNNQLASAKKEQVCMVLILGQKEVFEDVIIMRDIASGAQETVPLARIVNELKKYFNRKR